jgi:hypothetical protein
VSDPVASLYDTDEHRWIERQISLLETGELSALDRPNLIEFLTAMAARDKRELVSRLTVLLAHMIKIKFQPTHISRSWANTILEQQREIKQLLKTMPSLRPYVDVIFDDTYEDAVKQASVETGLPLNQLGFPNQYCSFEDAMKFDALHLRTP